MEHKSPVLTVPGDLSFDVRSREGNYRNNNKNSHRCNYYDGSIDEKKTEGNEGDADASKTNKSGSSGVGGNCNSNSNSYDIYLNEDWDSGIGGGLWTTGLALGKYFATSPHFLQQFRLLQLKGRWNSGDDDRPLRVLELGSGNGFLSVCLVTAVAVAAANRIFDDNDENENVTDTDTDTDTERIVDATKNWPGIEVVVTDTAEHLQLMKTTIESNLKRILPKILRDRQARKIAVAQEKKTNDGGYDDDDTNEATTTSKAPPSSPPARDIAIDIDIEKIASVKEYLWGEKYDFGSSSSPSSPSSSSFDLIVGSDVAYRDHLHEPLIAALKEFSKPQQQTIALIGVTMNDTKPIFFLKLIQEGFRYEKLADHLFDTEFSTCSRQFGIFAISRA